MLHDFGVNLGKDSFSPLVKSYMKIELEIERKSKAWKHKGGKKGCSVTRR